MRSFFTIFTLVSMSGCGVLVAGEPLPGGNEGSDAPPAQTTAPTPGAPTGTGTGTGTGTTPGATPSSACPGSADCPRLVFVTSARFRFDQIAVAADADALCQKSADQGSLQSVLAGKTFVAWLSDDSSTPLVRLTHGTKPYALVDGSQVARDFGQLLAHEQLDHAISIDENGDGESGDVWTGTRADGTGTKIACSGYGWDNEKSGGQKIGDPIGGVTATAIRGYITSSSGTWTDATSDGLCAAHSARLYCFER